MSNLFDERDELANEDAFGLTEADYEERADIFAAMDEADAQADYDEGEFSRFSDDYTDEDYESDYPDSDYGMDDGFSEFMEGYSENW